MGFGGYQDPLERRAAAEAAEAMEAQRALADSQTAALCEAIRDGFATLSSAIVATFGTAEWAGNPEPPEHGGLDIVLTGKLDGTTVDDSDDVADLLQNNDDLPDN